ncbi:Uu.00g118700.m01.CDS01 [Anthostomella pinea]|uniref:Uu.00g118700.m01.CDS01 n=1 Tax=Anthostomella pinea TaxID=933095 RepID=A0AAI8VGZ9_9PEZI|nr:Uu.00g118700.m01.CDS01 [Anthostomella pinea]
MSAISGFAAGSLAPADVSLLAVTPDEMYDSSSVATWTDEEDEENNEVENTDKTDYDSDPYIKPQLTQNTAPTIPMEWEKHDTSNNGDKQVSVYAAHNPTTTTQETPITNVAGLGAEVRQGAVGPTNPITDSDISARATGYSSPSSIQGRKPYDSESLGKNAGWQLGTSNETPIVTTTTSDALNTHATEPREAIPAIPCDGYDGLNGSKAGSGPPPQMSLQGFNSGRPGLPAPKAKSVTKDRDVVLADGTRERQYRVYWRIGGVMGQSREPSWEPARNVPPILLQRYHERKAAGTLRGKKFTILDYKMVALEDGRQVRYFKALRHRRQGSANEQRSNWYMEQELPPAVVQPYLESQPVSSDVTPIGAMPKHHDQAHQTPQESVPPPRAEALVLPKRRRGRPTRAEKARYEEVEAILRRDGIIVKRAGKPTKADRVRNKELQAGVPQKQYNVAASNYQPAAIPQKQFRYIAANYNPSANQEQRYGSLLQTPYSGTPIFPGQGQAVAAKGPAPRPYTPRFTEKSIWHPGSHGPKVPEQGHHQGAYHRGPYATGIPSPQPHTLPQPQTSPQPQNSTDLGMLYYRSALAAAEGLDWQQQGHHQGAYHRETYAADISSSQPQTSPQPENSTDLGMLHYRSALAAVEGLDRQ